MINWHYVRDDSIFSTIKVVSRHQNTHQYGATIPIELMNDEIRNTKAYKEYYAFATGEAVPKPKASARRKMSGSDTSITPPNATTTPTQIVAVTPRLTAAAKGKQTAKSLSAPSEEDQGLNVNEEEHVKEEEEDELYRDVNINQGRGLQATLKVKDTHVTLTPINSDGMESIFVTASSSVAPLHTSTPIMTPSTIATITTISQAPIPPTRISSEVLQNLPTFDSVFRFDERLKSLEANFSEYRQTNPFAEAVSNISSIVHQYMNQQMNEVVRVVVQIQTDRLRDSYQRENDEFLQTIDENMKRIIKEQVKGQVKEQVSKILPRIEQYVNAQLEAKVLTRSSHSSRTSYAVTADLSEMELKKILIEKMGGNKSIQRSDEQRNLYKALVDAYEADKIILDSYGETVILKRRRDDDDKDEEPSAGSDRGSKRRRECKEPESASAPLETATRSAGRSTTGSKSRQALASVFAFAEEPVQTTSQIEEPSHPVFETGSEDQPIFQSSQHPEWFSQSQKPPTPDHTPLDFSNFIKNRLRVDTLTPELLAGPTYELMKGSCTSLIEHEYHLEEVYKATTDQLDWVNPESQQYPHNMLEPPPLIPNNRGRRVIPFAHFINNDLEYLRGDLVPRTIWIQEPVDYDKHSLWGVSHWGSKRQQFYDFTVNRESALDVYSKRRIIAVTDLKIVEWHSYKHLDWISIRRDDDKIYKFKEGDFKRLRLQDIEDMLLLPVQGKLSNLTVEERFAFNVSLRIFTRSIVIQRRVEDLPLRVKSYQKRLNLTKPDTYRSDLKRKGADGTLNDVRIALDDRLKGIRMQYMPQTIWRKGDKDRAAAMIQAIDKMLKTRRIMRSLEKFVGGRL
nr:hypothetical protein [Tanacetum cinerariifolium]